MSTLLSPVFLLFSASLQHVWAHTCKGVGCLGYNVLIRGGNRIFQRREQAGHRVRCFAFLIGIKFAAADFTQALRTGAGN